MRPCVTVKQYLDVHGVAGASAVLASDTLVLHQQQ